jgi:hypothetical protein
VKLEGSLDAFSLPDVFQLLSLTRKSGALHLSHGPNGPHSTVRGVVHFCEGALSGAASDLDRQGLARRLVGQGVVDDAALRRAVDRAMDRNRGETVGVARALVQAGAVDAESVRSLAAEHTVDAVFDLLGWAEGDFAFAVDETNPDDVGLALASEDVVARARERRESWETVSRVIPSPAVVLTMPVVLAAPVDSLALTLEEWGLLALVDGNRTVGELVEVSGAGQFGVVAALATLVQRGLLALRDEDAPDHVELVRRRHALLAPLEEGAVAPSAEPVAAPEPVGEPTAAPAPDAGSLPPVEAATQPATQPTTQPATQMIAPLVVHPEQQAAPEADAPAAASPAVASPAAHTGGAHQPQGVVPERPEPYLPRRRPDYPEPGTTPAAAAASAFSSPRVSAPTHGSAAVHPATSPLIERDPSVNRSLLLRLIAGVRGL